MDPRRQLRLRTRVGFLNCVISCIGLLILWASAFMLLRLVINNRFAVIICFFHEEKQEDKAEAAKDCAPVL